MNLLCFAGLGRGSAHLPPLVLELSLYSYPSSSRQLPQRAVFAREVLLRLWPAGDAAFGGDVPHQALLAAEGNVPKQAGAGGAVADFHVADRPFARLDAINEIANAAVPCTARLIKYPRERSVLIYKSPLIQK